MMVSEVPLGRQVELPLIATREFRPTLAIGNAPVPLVDGRLAPGAALHDL